MSMIEFRLNILDIVAITVAILSIIITVVLTIYVSAVHDSTQKTHEHLIDIKEILKDNNDDNSMT